MNQTDSYALLIGLDWGHSEHAFALRAENGQRAQGKVAHTPEKLHQWIAELKTRFPDRPIAVETSRGPIIHALLEHPCITIDPIPPAASARFRRAFTPSGAKHDTPDALVLLELLEHHRDKLRPLQPEDALTRKLAGRVEARRKAVDRRTALLNALTAALRGYFPQVFALVGEDLASPLALDLLERWPDPITLKSAHPSTLRRFFYLHNVRRPACVDKRIEAVRTAVALTHDEAVLAVGQAEVACLVALLRVLQKHIAQFESDITAAFKAHPDAYWFRGVPGAGPTLAPGYSSPSAPTARAILTPRLFRSTRASRRSEKRAAIVSGSTGAGKHPASSDRPFMSGQARLSSGVPGPEPTTKNNSNGEKPTTPSFAPWLSSGSASCGNAGPHEPRTPRLVTWMPSLVGPNPSLEMLLNPPHQAKKMLLGYPQLLGYL